MAVNTFLADGQWNAGIEARIESGYRMLAYNGTLGGGSLQLFTQSGDGPKVPVPDSILNASKIDSNGDAIRQVLFLSAGNIWVHLTGATAPNATVVIA